mmetsp:Transcript_34859/g.72593  ORF Transcript_34859/g.72593 Transcript_34859/m.72593 type:complete len:922 (-) Transcript_34859:256-3021(-)
MKSSVGPLVLAVLLAAPTWVFAGGENNLRHGGDRALEVKTMKLWTEECTGLIGVGQMAGAINQEANETYFLACGLPNSGRSHNVEGACKEWIDNRVFKGHLYSNTTLLELPDTWLNDQTEHLELQHFPPGLINKEAMANATPQVGGRSVLAVIVRLQDASPTISEPALRDSLFGTDGDTRTLKSLYAGCSRNQLNFGPTSDRQGSTNPIAGGTVTLQVPVKVSAGDNVIRNAITDQLTEQFGVSSPAELADHVMYCVPQGAIPMASYSFVHNWLSVLTDTYCLHSNFQAHEIAHNLNLADSGQFVYHDDYTGLMGVHTNITTERRMCLNGAKLYQLHWYDKTTEVMTLLKSSPPTTVTVHSSLKDAGAGIKIVEFDRRSPYDFYLIFNWASGPNQDTPEGPNTVTITGTGRHGQSYYGSTLIAKLEEGDRFIQRGYFYGPCNLMVEVTEINVAEGYAVINFESCFDTVAAAEAAAAEIELQNKIKAYEEALAAQKAQEEAIAAAEASGQPVAPVVPINIPPAPPHPPYTPKPVPAATPRPTPYPTVSCVSEGGLCFHLSDCCMDGEGECKEESYADGGTYMLKCREKKDENSAGASEEELAAAKKVSEGGDIYGENLLGIYGGTCNDDGACTDGETCLNCPNDCKGNLVGDVEERYCCYGDIESDIQFGVRGDDMRCTCGQDTPREAKKCNGFVTGGGFILLDENAYLKRSDCVCDDITGICPECNAIDQVDRPKSNFGFNAKNFKGTPDGSTNFDIDGNGFHFHTLGGGGFQYDGLEVVCGDETYGYGATILARWTGIGKIAWTTGNKKANAGSWEEGYRFFISAQDYGEPGYQDTWRLRIMDRDSHAVLFDSDTSKGYIFDIDDFCGSPWDDCLGQPDFRGDSLGGEGEAKGGGNVQTHCKGGPGNAPCDPVIPQREEL